MNKHFRIISACCLTALQTFAQQPASVIRCGHELVMNKYQQVDPGYKHRLNQLGVHAQTNAKTTSTVFHVPVVFHVVYNTADENLPDSVILNQLDILNGAYRKRHADTGNVRSIFKPLSADAGIEFHLASVDPQGNPTTGIVRKPTTVTQFGDLVGLLSGDLSSIERIKYDAQGGSEQWDPKRYLNIWVADMSFPGVGILLLGIATPPLNPLPPNWQGGTGGLENLRDGVVLQYQAVGSNNPNVGAIVQLAGTAGRSAVHEVGHYFGLRHIWGDAQGTADSCTADGDDGIADTPDQASNSDISAGVCPSDVQNTCGAGIPGDLPDLWENYMDYSRDNCQSMFTSGQVSLMRSVCATQRDSLTTESPAGIFNPNGYTLPQVLVYPQPAVETMYMRFNFTPQRVQLFSLTGMLVEDYFTDQQSCTLNTGNLPDGQYVLRVQSAGQSISRPVMIRH